jgi:AcrR family transcriptional regulator
MYDDQDRRVRRTRRALADALIHLTSERPYHSIQVRDITDQADIGYATFYRHYDSKDDLMLAVFANATSELEASANEPGGKYFEREGQLIFEHVRKYEGLYRSILQSHNFVGQLKHLLTQRVEGQVQRHTPKPDVVAFPVEVAASHMVAGLIGLIEWWLKKDMSLPVEEMAHIYARLIVQATWYALIAGNELTLPWHS